MSPVRQHSGDRSAHTPGPWKVFLAKEGHRIIGIGELTGEGVADCGFGVWRGGSAEAIANARLIAAAPDMLAALQKIADHPADGFEGEVISMTARAAIAKATGA